MKKVFGFFSMAFLALALLTPAVFLTGCNATLAPQGVYQGDKILYNAEKAITASYTTFDEFLKWELTYRNILPVEVSRAADNIRLNAKKWISSANALRDAYAANPTKENGNKLNATLSIIDAALAEATKYMTKSAPVPATKPTTMIPKTNSDGTISVFDQGWGIWEKDHFAFGRSGSVWEFVYAKPPYNHLLAIREVN